VKAYCRPTLWQERSGEGDATKMEVEVAVVVKNSASVIDVKAVKVDVTVFAVTVMVIVDAMNTEDVAAVFVDVTVRVSGVTRQEQAEESRLGGYVPELSGAVRVSARCSISLLTASGVVVMVVTTTLPSISDFQAVWPDFIHSLCRSDKNRRHCSGNSHRSEECRRKSSSFC
jgi:hypothetical protein